MLEKIGQRGFETLSKPDEVVLGYLDQLLSTGDEIVFYEIGVGIGATTLPVVEKLAGRGRVVLFSREEDVRELAADLKELGFQNIDSSWGSPSKVYSGYHFELARGFADGVLPSFDLAYLDGGHVFHLDAAAACVLKELCNVGGYIVLDDWSWSLAKSPTLNPSVHPKTADEYDANQIERSHVQLVCQTVMDTDSRFEFLGVEHNSAAYRRASSGRH